MSAIKYRSDIDGLRALAVLPVVLFHADLSGLSGGYVGVDVFFVISGYLITRILFTDMQAGRFSLAEFYERRIRRIFPALFAMCAVVLVASAFLVMPYDYKELGESAAATAVFGSNVFFWLKAGYFDYGAETKPLLHTWSLGIEEQYYIVWPIILFCILKWARQRMLTIVVGLLLLSLAASISMLGRSPSTAFYLIPFRMWELMVGSLLALGAFPRLGTGRSAWLAGLAGLALIVLPVMLYDSATPFPGLAAVPPCLGAALLIASGQEKSSPAARLLALKPLELIGRISYSLYLWHWPVIVLAKYYLRREFETLDIAMVVAASVVMAVLSYHFVEKPFRRPGRPSRRACFGGAATIMVAVILFGAGTYAGQGFPGRFAPEVRHAAAATLDTNPQRIACDRKTPDQIKAGNLCVIGDIGQEPSFVLIGDSFADAVAPGLGVAARNQGRAGYVITYSGCFPLPEVDQRGLKCRPAISAAFDFIAARPHLRTVVVAARWSTAVHGDRMGAFTENFFLADAQTREMGSAENGAVVDRALRRMLDGLKDREVSVLAYIPEQLVDVPRELAVRKLRGERADVGVPLTTFAARQAGVRTIFDRLREDYGHLRVVDLQPAFCGGERCAVEKDGVILYADDNHLSRSAAMTIRPWLAEALGETNTAEGRVGLLQ